MEMVTKTPQMLKSVGQSVLSLSFGLGGMLSGALIVSYFNVLSIAPWVLTLFPGILSVRGAIGGLLSGRLSTALHLGTIKASYAKNTDQFFSLLKAITVLTLESSVIVAIFASLFGIFLWNAKIVDLINILMVMIATLAISLIIITPVIIAVSISAFRYGLDPDIIVYPIISTISDISVTACYVLVLNAFFFVNSIGRYIIGLIDLIFVLVSLYLVIKNVQKNDFTKTLTESFITILSIAFIVNITGSFLKAINQVIGYRPEIFTLYPALINTVGSAGSIVGSTVTTKLFLGLSTPTFSSFKKHIAKIGEVWISSLIMFAVYIATSSSIHRLTSNRLLGITIQLFITNILAVSITVIIAYSTAIFTFRKGWNPDNFVIPIESSLADITTTISLLLALIFAAF
jgi:mgtE-like transporter